MSESKICPQCKQEKSLSEYFNDKQRHDGKTYLCKVCHSKNRRESHRAKKLSPQMDPDFKRCTRCGMLKSKTEFNKSKYERDGFMKHCRSCNPSRRVKAVTENAA